MDIRENILDAATELIRQNGPAGAKARAVCNMVGIKAPTLYYYFSDMEALREEVVRRTFARILDSSSIGWRTKPGIEGLRQSWDTYMGFAFKEPAMFTILANRIMHGPVPEIAFGTLSQFEAALSAPEFQGRLRFSPTRSAHVLWAAAQGAGTLLVSRGTGLPVNPGLGEDLL